MLRAVYNGVVLAETPRTLRVEGSHYFPPESINRRYFEDSPSKSVWPWKGVARYYNVDAGEEIAPDLAWSYRRPWPWARWIKDHVAFYGQVVVEGEPEGPQPGRPSSARAAR